MLSVTSVAATERAVTPPEFGQLVEVRRRQWVVANVQASTMENGCYIKQHLITLSSIDEDALGEQLEVIWEIEPGVRIIERDGLPNISGYGYDNTQKLEAFLNAVRWGAATNADRDFLQAPFRSGVCIEDFQLDPMVRAIGMASANLLLADDVGLGKTIEAGLVIQELMLRHRARTILVVCPASLQEKWRVEMLEKFGLEFRTVNTGYIKELRRNRGIHANPWISFPRLITSMDWLKSGDPLRAMNKVLPVRATYPRKFDVLIVDEAHNVAPPKSANYALDSLRTRLIRTLSPHFQHRLFLTATPHNGCTASFTSLLELLDDQRFSRNILPDEQHLSQVMIRRLKTELVNSDGNQYPKRELKALAIPFTAEERTIYKTLHDYCRSRERTCQGTGTPGTKFVNSLLKKRFFSSPAAFASTLEKHFETLTTVKVAAKSNVMTDRILKKAILKIEDDYADDAQVEAAQTEAVEEATKQSTPLATDERKLLNEMMEWAKKARNRMDSKARAIVEWIGNNLRTDGEWNERRVVLFTEYRTTHQWLREMLTAQNYGGERLGMIHGGMSQDEREPVKAAFQTNPNDAAIRILLATDAASEGVDLQNHCNYLIHIEIPYNPNVMEQRNGRIDRYGQKQREVLIWHPADGGDAANDNLGGHQGDVIRALNKLEAMREDMGSVNPVIAPQMAGLIEGTRQKLDTRETEARAAAKRDFQVKRQVKERIARLHEKLQETRKNLHLTPDRIYETVKTGLALAEKPHLIPVKLEGASSGTVFEMPTLTGSWARCMEGLCHPHTQKQRPITFDHNVAKNRDDVVLVHLNHRLVQMCLRLMRAEVWAHDDVKKLNRIGVRRVPASDFDDVAVAVVSRLVITGGKHHRLHEELTVSGGYFKNKGFSRETKVTQVNRWLEDARSYEPDDAIFNDLAARFNKNREAIQRALEARSTERLRNLQNTLESRKQQEIKNIASVLDELRHTIKQELQKPEQLYLFNENERNQVCRDNEALKARLARIPEEKKQEFKAIKDRYEDFAARTFPIAVIFLIPDSMAKGSAA